jgi:hypothetical protein
VIAPQKSTSCGVSFASSETTILSLAAQIETARPCQDRRPELTSHQDIR